MGPSAKNLIVPLAACVTSFVKALFRLGSALVAWSRIPLMSLPLRGILIHLVGSENENPYLDSSTRVPAAAAGSARSPATAPETTRNAKLRRDGNHLLNRSSSGNSEEHR